MNDSLEPSRQKPRITAAKRQVIREDYLMGNGALHVLAARHGIPLSTLHRWSASEHWIELRKEHTALRLGKLCPSQSPRVPATPPLDLGDDTDAMGKRRAMGLGVVQEQIRLLLQRQKESTNGDKWLAISRALGEHAERLLKMAGLIPRPAQQKAKRTYQADAVPLD
jgi:hypothetical protein